MLQRKYRLTRKRDFEILFAEGRFVGGTLVQAKVWRMDPEKYPKRGYSIDDTKIGFVVSTKVSKSAVKRNRIKRRMREIVRLLVKDGKIQNGFMLAIMAKPNALGAEYRDLGKDVHDVLRRARMIK